EKFGRIRLHEQFGFEVEAWGEAKIGMRRPRETINATVLAAAIRIDGAVERDVRRVIPSDDLAGGVDRYCGLERRQLLQPLPAVMEAAPRQRFISAGRVRGRAAATPTFAIDGGTDLLARRHGGQRCRRALQRR